MSEVNFDQQIIAFLSVCRTASLATVNEFGHPHASNVQFVSDATLKLYFVSSPFTAHAKHIAERPQIALTVYAHNDNPDTIHGVQIHASCKAVDSLAEREQVLKIYAAKFPIVVESEAMRQMLTKQRFYRVTPTWLRWIDNRVRFGFKVEKAMGKA